MLCGDSVAREEHVRKSGRVWYHTKSASVMARICPLEPPGVARMAASHVEASRKDDASEYLDQLVLSRWRRPRRRGIQEPRGRYPQREEPAKPRTNAAISSAAVSNAKWPASRM